MKATFLGLLLIVTTLVTGCSVGERTKTLDIADIGWTENTAIANLTILTTGTEPLLTPLRGMPDWLVLPVVLAAVLHKSPC